MMPTDARIQELLHWRLRQAEAEAPLAPSAAHLLALARPWWEALPERFQALVDRLRQIQVAYAHAQADPRDFRAGHPVPALIVRAEEELESAARLLYLEVRNGRLRLRFQLDAALEPAAQALDVTFIPESPMEAPFSAHAVLSLDKEYHLEGELPEGVARRWEGWKVDQRIPYRMILRPGESVG
jgi:hypothetical protein